MRNLALADLTPADLAAMLAENETIFVEHKGGLEYAAAKAICSFANTLGGWVLIGVSNGAANEGQEGGWVPAPPAELTDRVRECLKTNKVDPIPAFAATVPTFCEEGQRIGVVRVHESDDAPHIIGNGQVFVRSVAQDENRQRVYRAGGVETHAVLVELVDRGRRGVQKARDRLDEAAGPFALKELGFRSAVGGEWRLDDGIVVLRAAPVTHRRLEDWAVSEAAMDALDTTARRLGQVTDDTTVARHVHVSCLAARVRGDVRLYGSDEVTRHPSAAMATDAAGIVGASMLWGNPSPPIPAVRMTLNGFRDQLIVPLLNAVCDMLSTAELFGRSILQLDIGQLEQVAVLEHDGEIRPIPPIPLGGEIALPLDIERADLRGVADQWRDDIARGAGFERFRT